MDRKSMGLSIDDVIAQIKGSLDIILEYAGIDGDNAQTIRALMKKYIECEDRAASDDETRKLRKELTKAFYLTYKKCYFKTISDEAIPLPVKMFMYFITSLGSVMMPRIANVFAKNKNNNEVNDYMKYMKDEETQV